MPSEENPEDLSMMRIWREIHSLGFIAEWYAKDISKKVTTGIKTKGMSGKPIMTEAPYGYIKDPNQKDYWQIDEAAAEVVRLIYSLFMAGNNRNQICNHLREKQIPTPTFYMKDQDRGTAKSKALSEANRFKWNKASVTHILTRQEYCGDVVNFKTTKHYRDKRNHYVDKSEWHITENVHEPIIDRAAYENVQRILENAPVKRPNGDGYIHPLSGLLFCKDCGAKLHIRTDRRKDEYRHIARCSEYAKGKGGGAKCFTQHQIDCDALMENIAELLRKIAKYSLDNKAKFEALVTESLALQQTDEMKKQRKRIPQISSRLEQIEKVMNKLYEDNALEKIDQDRYEQLTLKYSDEYFLLKKELTEAQEQISDRESASQRAKKFIKLVESYCDFNDLTPTAINEFISKLVVHERHAKRARYAIQHVEVHFNYIGTFENELTELAEPTEQELERMKAEIEEAKKEATRAYHRAYRKSYREKNIKKCCEYERMKAQEYRAKKKEQTTLQAAI